LMLVSFPIVYNSDSKGGATFAFSLPLANNNKSHSNGNKSSRLLDIFLLMFLTSQIRK
jgi:hypothetical protein